MGWFSDTFNFETLAPIAAGIILPGWGGVLAGSAIGAATSDDPLTGALTGGLGAYGGQSLASSFLPGGISSLVSSAPAATTTVAPSALGGTAASTAGKSAATTALTNAGSSIPGAAPTFTMPSLGGAAAPVSSGFTMPYSGAGAGITTPSLGGAGGFSAAPVSSGFTMPYSGAGAEITTPSFPSGAAYNPSFMEGLSDYGGGGKYGNFKGAGKLGLTVAGMGLSGGAFDPEPMEFEMSDKYKFDPTRRLDLSNDTGLRLLAAQGGMVPGYKEGGRAAPVDSYLERTFGDNPPLSAREKLLKFVDATAQMESDGNYQARELGGTTTAAGGYQYVKDSVKPSLNRVERFGPLSPEMQAMKRAYANPNISAQQHYEFMSNLPKDQQREMFIADIIDGRLMGDERGGEGDALLKRLVTSEDPDEERAAARELYLRGHHRSVTGPDEATKKRMDKFYGNTYAGGGYLEGGGVGDGMSDDIPANIDGEQEAALSEGEFVIPADVVSHLGNGSSNAGARRLYDMMATIREARTGNSKQGVEIEAEEYMPYNMVESQSRRV
jgi:hypothetical protein